MKIFYSWQSDLPNSTNRGFIRNALIDAVKRLGKELDIDEAERPEVDEATKDTKGMVDITASILRKITECAVYVADVTPIVHSKKRAIPNPNVMYELGWASHSPGYDFIIGVMNVHKNKGPESLPFDLRGRRILTYRLAEEAPADTRKAVHKGLTDDLLAALKVNLADVKDKAAAETAIVPSPHDPTDISLWSGNNMQISVPESFGRLQTIEIERGPRAYARIIPASWASGHPPDALVVQKASPEVNPQSGGYSSGSFGTCQLGFARFWYSQVNDTRRSTRSIAIYLEDYGEYWFADATPFGEAERGTYLEPNSLLRTWYHCPLQAMHQLDALGASPRRRIEIGAIGTQSVFLAHRSPFFHTPQSRKPSVRHVLERNTWTAEDLRAFVHAAYNMVLSAFSLGPISGEEFNKVLARL